LNNARYRNGARIKRVGTFVMGLALDEAMAGISHMCTLIPTAFGAVLVLTGLDGAKRSLRIWARNLRLARGL
jgi:hypothetical protein